MLRSALHSLAEVRPQLLAALHQHLNLHPEAPISELAEVVKALGRPLSFTWNTSSEITAVISAVLAQRARQGTGT